MFILSVCFRVSHTGRKCVLWIIMCQKKKIISCNCVCVCVCERERERVCASRLRVCVGVCEPVCMSLHMYVCVCVWEREWVCVADNYPKRLPNRLVQRRGLYGAPPPPQSLLSRCCAGLLATIPLESELGFECGSGVHGESSDVFNTGLWFSPQFVLWDIIHPLTPDSNHCCA